MFDLLYLLVGAVMVLLIFVSLLKGLNYFIDYGRAGRLIVFTLLGCTLFLFASAYMIRPSEEALKNAVGPTIGDNLRFNYQLKQYDFGWFNVYFANDKSTYLSILNQYFQIK
jgi:hypothetical protein